MGLFTSTIKKAVEMIDAGKVNESGNILNEVLNNSDQEHIYCVNGCKFSN